MNPNMLMSYIIEAMINSGCSLRMDYWDSILKEHFKFDLSYDKDLQSYNLEMRKERYG